jgi:hypothetical protein
MSPVTFIIICLILLGMLLPVPPCTTYSEDIVDAMFVQRLQLTGHPHSRTQPHSKSRLILTFCVCVCVCVA